LSNNGLLIITWLSKPYWYKEDRTNKARYDFKEIADKYKINVDILYDSLDWKNQNYPVKIKGKNNYDK